MTRRLLLLLLLIGAAGNLGGAGTLASFNASTTNPGATFATGTIVLSDLHGGTANTCFSNGTTASGAGANTDTNANASCDAAFTVATAKPGQTATVDLTLANEGTLPGTLKLYAPASCAPTDGAGAYHGTGDLCDPVRLSIQRYTSAARSTTSACVYGVPSGNDCTSDASRFIDHFTDTHLGVANAISLGTLAAANGGDTDAAFLRLTLEFPNGAAGADNVYQGRVATWAFQWLLEQQ